jgi:hemerythrin-like domain-containing protein
MAQNAFEDRRRFLSLAAPAAAFALAGCVTHPAGQDRRERKGAADEAGDEAEVTPGEDLMQEHGVVERLLLVYAEAARRIDRHESLDPTVVSQAAGIVRRFVQDYHEKLEEQFVFPRLKAAGKETALVEILLLQHERGRKVTDEIVRLCAVAPGPELAQRLKDFERMYRPHAAREDTVLFPAFRGVVGRQAYRDLGEAFEDEERERFGDEGFEMVVAQVARLEDALGIGDLGGFTARV